jgi:hypothetical protein
VRYKVDEKRTAHQEVDGEVIAIDFVSGAYFSMQGTAAEIWQMLSAGVALSAVVDHYRTEAQVPAEIAESEIVAFASELVAAELLAETAVTDAAEPVSPLHIGPLQSYGTPRLEKFEDMAELIMLDPVHDVSDAGWPNVPR